MNNNTINHLQPTTIQPILKKFYPTADNTIENPMGISNEDVESTKRKPISERVVSFYFTTPSDTPISSVREAYLRPLLESVYPQVEALRIEPNYIKKKHREDELPIFTPCCVLNYGYRNVFVGERQDFDSITLEPLEKNVSLVKPQPLSIRHYQTYESKPYYFPINYTCLLDFDILQDDNPNIDFVELKPALEALRHIYYCGRATNGIDLFCIVPISTPQRYAAHARALIHQFKKQGIIIRVADSITHTRTLSSDPSGYFNENAAEFTKFWD